MNSLLRFLGIFHLCACLLVAFSSVTTATSQAEDTLEGPSPFQFGMEIEISGHHGLRNLVRYFEFSSGALALERTIIEANLTPAEIDAYLTPETFEMLPASLRENLTEGIEEDRPLQIQAKPIIVNQAPEPQNKIITSSREKSPSTASKSEFRTSGGIILTQNPEQQSKELAVSDIVKREVRWKKIVERWKRIEPSARISIMRIDGLPPSKIASLWMDKKIPQTWIKPRKTNPPQVANLLNNLEWENTAGLVEFRHKRPLNGQELYLKDVQLFSEMAGIARYINDPNTTFPPDPLRYTYHVHVSRKGASLDEVADRLNKVLLLKMVEQGRGEGAIRSRFGFSPIAHKGLLRRVEKDRIEYRSHVESPRAELDRYMPYMSRPTAEVISELDGQISEGAKKVKELLRAELTKTKELPDKFIYKPQENAIELYNLILNSVERPLRKETLTSVIGAELDTAIGQARLLKLLETVNDRNDFTLILDGLNKETLDKYFIELEPVAERLESSDQLFRRAVDVRMDEKQIYNKIKTAAMQFLEIHKDSSSPPSFSPSLLQLLPPKERAKFAKEISNSRPPRNFRILRNLFWGHKTEIGTELAELVSNRVKNEVQEFSQYEAIYKSLFRADSDDPFEAQLRQEYDARAMREKTVWDDSDWKLIDRIPKERKDVLSRIMLNHEQLSSAPLLAFRRMMKIGVPLGQIPIKEFLSKTRTSSQRQAVVMLLEAAENSPSKRREVKALLRGFDWEELLARARLNDFSLPSNGLLKELAIEAVAKPPTKGTLELIEYVHWIDTEINTKIDKEANSIKVLTAMIEKSKSPDWDEVLISNLYRGESIYLSAPKSLSTEDKKAVVALLSRNFNRMGNDANLAASLYEIIQDNSNLRAAFGDTLAPIKHYHKQYTNNRFGARRCIDLYKNL